MHIALHTRKLMCRLPPQHKKLEILSKVELLFSFSSAEGNCVENRAAASLCETFNMADKKIVAGIGSVLVVGIALTIALIAGSVHVVQQGTVGIYFVNGRLADTLAFPGDYNEKVATRNFLARTYWGGP